jgi:hypothetical protein
MIKCIFIFLCLAMCGCKQDDFSPVNNYEEKPVLFSILDSRNDITLLYLQKNSNTWNINDRLLLPEDLLIKVIKDDGSVYFFRDTIITGITDFKVYYYKSIKPNTGVYTLHLTAKNLTEISSTINFPTACRVNTIYYFDYREVTINSFAGNYRFRFNIYYEQKIENDWVLKHEEAPIVKPIAIGEIIEYPGDAFVEESQKTFRITDETVQKCINDKILPRAAKDDIRIIRGCLVIENYEPNLANYLKSVNGFYDNFSVRLDQLGYSNINNGLGIFGAIRVDTIVIFSSR